ncbi:MAG: very short patch repair endonuclease [Nitrososphaera sp.]
MADNLSKDKRSKVMASIRGKNTMPELVVRRLLWASGKRYRIHDRAVYGTPDISNKKKKVAIFIDGCFWHGCTNCYKEPTSNISYWRDKIIRNKDRRNMVIKKLSEGNWTVLQYWEHRVIREPETVAREIAAFL